ncbi:unnamed protein product [Closterium sp. NIES-65]|nr:unnamed protein product [Closterium sp. NIES-65]
MLREGASLAACTLLVETGRLTVGFGAAVTAKGLAAKAPDQTSGTPTDGKGSGGGYGGRGASCSVNSAMHRSMNSGNAGGRSGRSGSSGRGGVGGGNSAMGESGGGGGWGAEAESWGGDAYAWSTLTDPWKTGSKGGALGEADGGGLGGGRVRIVVRGDVVVEGRIDADGGDAQMGSMGRLGGGGSGGSVFVNASSIQGTGRICANGGKGHGGGAGGRVAIQYQPPPTSRSPSPSSPSPSASPSPSSALSPALYIQATGGPSEACPYNAGSAGTVFNWAKQTLVIGNSNQPSHTFTPLFTVPLYPYWDGIIVEGGAKVVALTRNFRLRIRSCVWFREGSSVLFGSSTGGGGGGGGGGGDQPAPSPPLDPDEAEVEVVVANLTLTNATLEVYGTIKVFASHFNLHSTSSLRIHQLAGAAAAAACTARQLSGGDGSGSSNGSGGSESGRTSSSSSKGRRGANGRKPHKSGLSMGFSSIDGNYLSLTGGSSLVSSGHVWLHGQNELALGGRSLLTAKKLLISMFIAVRVLGGSRIAAPLSHAALLHLQSLSEGGSSNPNYYSLLQPDFPLQPDSPLQPSVSLVQRQPNSGKVTSGRWGSNFSSSSSSSYSAVASQYGGFAVQTGDLPYCHVEECPSSVVQPNHDCSSEDESPFSLHVCRLDSLYVQGAMEGALVRIDASSSLVIDHRASISASGLGAMEGALVRIDASSSLVIDHRASISASGLGCLPGHGIEHGEEDALRQPGGVEEGGIGELLILRILGPSLSPPCPLRVPSLSPPCPLLVPSLSPPCPLLVPSLSPPCPLLVPSLSPPCPLLVPSLSPPCPLLVPSLSPPCPLLVPSLSPPYPLLIPSLSPPYPLLVPSLSPSGPCTLGCLLGHGVGHGMAATHQQRVMEERGAWGKERLSFSSRSPSCLPSCAQPPFSFPLGCLPGHGVGHGRDAPAGGSGGGGHGKTKGSFFALSHSTFPPLPPGCPPGHGVGHGRDAPAGGSGGGGHGGKKDPFSPLSHLPVCPPFHAQPLFVFPPGCPPGHGVGHGRDAPAGGSGGGGHGGKGGAGHFNGSRAAGGAAYGRTMPPCSVGSGGGLGPEGRGNSGGGLIGGWGDKWVKALCPVARLELWAALWQQVFALSLIFSFSSHLLSAFLPFRRFPPSVGPCGSLGALEQLSGSRRLVSQHAYLLGPVARLELWGGSLAADGSFLNTRTVGGEGMGLGMGGGGVRGGERRVGSGGAGLEGKEVGMTGGSEEVGSGGVGGGAGGTVVIHAAYLNMTRGSVISAAGGQGHSVGGGGGGGGKVYFAWQNLERTRGDEYTPRATIEGNWTDVIRTSGGQGSYEGEDGEAGLTGSADCPPGLVGLLCEECPVGTFKSQSGSDPSLCLRCPLDLLPHHAEFTYKRGGASATPCPYRCLSSHFSLPHCDTPMEGLIRDLGGPWVFALACTLSVLLLGFAITLARARLLLAGDDLAQPQTRDSDVSSHMDHSLPFLESLNEVMENTRVEEAASHVHRVFFCGDNSFSHPLHLPHSPPRAISDLVYEDSYNRLVDEVNAIACYRWWEGCVHSLLALLALPFAWSWQQWRRRLVVQRLREFVHTRYDHSCLRSCRSRALYEGLKVSATPYLVLGYMDVCLVSASHPLVPPGTPWYLWYLQTKCHLPQVSATPDLVLGYMDVFLGGDEMATHMLPSFADRLPLLLVLGGNGSYMAPYHLFTDDLLTNIISQAIPPTVWYRLVAGLNAHLRTVSHGSLQRSLKPLLRWLCTHVNPSLEAHGVSAHLAWLQVRPGCCRCALVAAGAPWLLQVRPWLLQVRPWLLQVRPWLLQVRPLLCSSSLSCPFIWSRPLHPELRCLCMHVNHPLKAHDASAAHLAWLQVPCPSPPILLSVSALQSLPCKVTPSSLLSISFCPSVSLHRFLSISFSPSVSLHQFLSISFSPSVSLHQFLSISFSPSVSLHHFHSISFSPSVPLRQFLSISFSPSVSLHQFLSFSFSPSLYLHHFLSISFSSSAMTTSPLPSPFPVPPSLPLPAPTCPPHQDNPARPPTSASIIQLALCLDHPESTDHCNDYLPSSSAAAAAAADTAGHFSAPSLTSFASAAAPNLASFGSSFGSSRLGGFGGSDTGWGRPVERTRPGGSVSALPSPRTATLSHSALPPAALPSSAFAPVSLLSSHAQALFEHRPSLSILPSAEPTPGPAGSAHFAPRFDTGSGSGLARSIHGSIPENLSLLSDKDTRRGGERREVERQISSVSAGLLWQAAGGRVGKRQQGGLIDAQVLQRLDGGRGLCLPGCGLLLRNTLPVGHDAAVGLAMSMLLLADLCLFLLCLLQSYSTSLLAFALMLFVLPLAPLFSAAAGLNALFAHGARGGAGLGRVYGLWNVTSLANGVVAVTLGVFHVWQTYKGTPSGAPPRESAAAEEFTWLLFPAMFVACKLAQARVIDRHVANLEIQDRTLLAEDPTVFWEA